MKKIVYLFLLLTSLSLLAGCVDNTISAVTGFVKESVIANKEPAFYRKEEYSYWTRGELEQLPEIQNMGFDLRSYDISKFDLSQEERLNNVTFDTKTIWSEKLPAGFYPDEILEIGKNPGLKIQNLHKQGFTGKGINIAIVDQALLLEHEEYKDNLMTYELLHCSDPMAQMHGAAVTSIAAGKNCGVAPDAKIYYIASTFGTYKKDGTFTEDLTPMADSILHILEINEQLPKEDKIKVISISRGFNNEIKGGKEVFKAIEEAKKSGVFVITTSNEETYGFSLMGLGREITDSPDDLNSYKAGIFWAENFYNDGFLLENTLLVPMDARTYASFTSPNDYAFETSGGLSWSVPWLAGMYALCLQKIPDLTPEKFIKTAFETGDTISFDYNEKSYQLATVINPEKLLHAIQ